MWKLLTASAVSFVALSVSLPAVADQEFHTLRLPLTALGAPGHPDLRAGHVIDIHSDSDNTAGHELYQVSGAAPLTDYTIVLDLNLSGCGGPGPMVPFANGVVLSTDARGNGNASTVLTQDDLAGVVGLNLGISWRLVVGPTVFVDPGSGLPLAVGGVSAYSTGDCVPVFIDDNQNGRP